MTAILPADRLPGAPASQRAKREPMTTPPQRRISAPWADDLFANLARLAALITLSLLLGIMVSLIIGAWLSDTLRRLWQAIHRLALRSIW